ncbi:MAG: PadR family transcriptional regulator [Pyrinomonadaceae bacterium]
MTNPNTDHLHGALDLLVLKTLDTLGPLNGWDIANRIQQISEDVLTLNQGSLYPALQRLLTKRWVASEWGTSENNRRARFYRITASGRKQLAKETQEWERFTAAVVRILQTN